MRICGVPSPRRRSLDPVSMGSLHRAAAGDQVNHEKNGRNDQNNVDERADDMEDEERPNPNKEEQQS